jgi:hypothetical protein
MNEDKRREPRLISTERETLAPVDDRQSDTDTGNYISQLASAWSAVRKKSTENL